ncbi:MAG: hypothetical protein C5B58_16245 [Acidobacteria bacterium]|nr:MAG: hypothetical protein C5B58_16245 [Acidobacteriota bacterium]
MIGPAFRTTYPGIEFIHAAYLVYCEPTFLNVKKLQEYLQRYPFGEKPKAIQDLEFSLTYVTQPNKRLKTPFILSEELTQRGRNAVTSAILECLPHETYFVPSEGSEGLYGTYSGKGLLPIPDWPSAKVTAPIESEPGVKTYHLKPLPVVGQPLGFIEPPKVIADAVEFDPPTARQMMYLRFWGLGKVISKKGFMPWRMRIERELPTRALAWEHWKNENPALDASKNPDNVPLGIGYEYLTRIEAARAAGETSPAVVQCPSPTFVELFGPAKPARPVPEKTWISRREEEQQGFTIQISADINSGTFKIESTYGRIESSEAGET